MKFKSAGKRSCWRLNGLTTPRSAAKTASHGLLAVFLGSLSAGLAAKSVDNIRDVFKQAMEERRVGETGRSIALFEDILDRAPALSRVRLELAASYFQAKDYSRAESQMGQVLKDESLPPAVRANGERFLTEILAARERSRRPSQFRGGIRLGVGLDSNANLAPEDANLDIGILPDSALEQDDSYVTASLYLKHRYRFSNGAGSAESPRLVWRNGIDTRIRDYRRVDDSDLAVTGLYSQIRLESSGRWRSGLMLKLDSIRLADNALAEFYSLQPSYSRYFGKALLDTSLSLSALNYRGAGNAGKEGRRARVSGYLSWPIKPDVNLKFGMQAEQARVEENWRSYDSLVYSVSLYRRLTSRCSLLLSTSYQDRHYESPEPGYGRIRNDHALRAAAGVKYRLATNLHWGLKWAYTDRRSNNDLHSYRENRVETYLGYRF